jgi:transcriptional regulator with XRE-family HTH domain
MSHSHSHNHNHSQIPNVAEVIAPVPTLRLGTLLRQKREVLGLGQREAAVMSLVGPDELSGIEAGRRRPDADAVARLAETYGCSVQDLVPPRQPLDPAVFDGLSDAEILKHYLAMVRTWRETERPQCFRADDLQTLVGILGTDVTLIEGKIRALTGCSRKTAKWFRRLFVLGLAASAGALLYQGSAAAAGDSAGQSHPAPATTAGVAAHNPALRAPVVCHSPSVTTAPVPSGTSRPGAVVKVSVAVMAYVDIQLDSTGTPVAVRTNTGNAPDCEASWYVFGPQHTSGDALENMAVINQVMNSVAGAAALPAAGQWLPGNWYSI